MPTKKTAPNNDSEILSQMIYGEAADQPYEVMRRFGSTAINRLNSPRKKEFGSTMSEILNKKGAYYAIKNNVIPYQQAVAGNFPTAQSFHKYGMAGSIADALLRKDIEPKEGLFMLTDSEVEKVKRNGSMDMSLLKEVDREGKYGVYTYK